MSEWHFGVAKPIGDPQQPEGRALAFDATADLVHHGQALSVGVWRSPDAPSDRLEQIGS